MEKNIKNKISFDEFREVKLYKSTNYKEFKILEYNREINNGHVEKLKDQLSTDRNDLHLKPIIVTPDKEIIDGQHRFVAAKSLGIPFYYLIDYDFKPEKLITHNTLHKTWNSSDSFKFYINQGNDNYFKLDQLIKKYNPIQLETMCRIVIKDDRSDIRRNFREGKYKYILTKENLRVLDTWKCLHDRLKDKGWKQQSLYNSSSYVFAINNFFSNNSIDINRFFEKFDRKPFSLSIFGSSYDFMVWLADIYNYDVRSSHKVRIYRLGNKTEMNFT